VLVGVRGDWCEARMSAIGPVCASGISVTIDAVLSGGTHVGKKILMVGSDR
jgi:hypothetical protein